MSHGADAPTAEDAGLPPVVADVYVAAANVAGFVRVAEATPASGLI